MRRIKAGLAYFGLVFGAGFMLGSVRVPFLVPRVGVRVAELIETPIMFVVVLLAARFVVRRFALAPAAASRLAVGLIALALLLAAEMTLVTVLQGLTLAGYIRSRDPVAGSVYVAMLIVFAAMPLILVRWERGEAPAPRADPRKAR